MGTGLLDGGSAAERSSYLPTQHGAPFGFRDPMQQHSLHIAGNRPGKWLPIPLFTVFLRDGRSSSKLSEPEEVLT